MKLAVITTVYRPDSHADVILARWLENLPHDKRWGWAGPRTCIATAYVAQRPSTDLSEARFAEHPVAVYPTIAEVLRDGGPSLAVDGVLLIAEHGEYPYNAAGQHMYPRAEMFHEIADVFEADGRTAPVFIDKHLSWDLKRAEGMIERARQLGFEVLSASSIPFCRHDPPIDVEGDRVDEAVAIFPLVNGGKTESYGYHSLEFVQHTLERRAGGAAGVGRLTAWRGEEAWAAAEDNHWPRNLFDAVCAHAMSDQPRPTAATEHEAEHDTHVFRLDYADGLSVTHVGLASCQQFAFGVRRGQRINTTVARAGEGPSERYPNFAILSRVVEDWLLGGPPPYPDARALQTCGVLQAMAQVLSLPAGEALPTPQLTRFSYQPSPHRTGIDFL
ncbi:MAG: hypothetical protein AAF593_00075 [Planctomycetota bacterium]